MEEPTITFCGHTYCRRCIKQVIENTSRCPNCNSSLSKDKFCPNFALSDLITRHRIKLNEATSEVYEVEQSTTPVSSDLVKTLTSPSNLSLPDIDRLLMVLQRRREVLATEDDHYKRHLLQEFLSQLLKIKSSQVEQLHREIDQISQDISLVRVPPEVPLPPEDLASSSSPPGFNTQPLHLESHKNSLSARKKRMYQHFDELARVYFQSRTYPPPVRVPNVDDATVPNNLPDAHEDSDLLRNFGRALGQITQYHSLKPLATLSYDNSDDEVMLSSNANIVSSIEFDKDNEFFAIAGVTKKIKLYEYLNVIGSSVEIHCPSGELQCSAKISCVSWSSYYKNQLASSDYDGTVILWDCCRATKQTSFAEHEKRVWSVDWSNGDPRLLASGSDDGKVKLWSTELDRSVVTLEAKANICCVQFCPVNTHVIAFGSADHCVHYYDLRSPKDPLGVLCGHKKAVSYVKFCGVQELISASTDSHLKLWNLDESQMNCTRTFSGHTNEKNFVGLATDGNYLACGSENNSLYVYYKELSQPLFSFKFENYGKGGYTGDRTGKQDDGGEFVSAVGWKVGSPVLVAANSQGIVKILEMI